MMSDDDDYEPYGLKVELRHPMRPTVALVVSWPQEKDEGILMQASQDMMRHLLTISRDLGEGEHEVP